LNNCRSGGMFCCKKPRDSHGVFFIALCSFFAIYLFIIMNGVSGGVFLLPFVVFCHCYYLFVHYYEWCIGRGFFIPLCCCFYEILFMKFFSFSYFIFSLFLSFSYFIFVLFFSFIILYLYYFFISYSIFVLFFSFSYFIFELF